MSETKTTESIVDSILESATNKAQAPAHIGKPLFEDDLKDEDKPIFSECSLEEMLEAVIVREEEK
jgi:hypothetical protein